MQAYLGKPIYKKDKEKLVDLVRYLVFSPEVEN